MCNVSIHTVLMCFILASFLDHMSCFQRYPLSYFILVRFILILFILAYFLDYVLILILILIFFFLFIRFYFLENYKRQLLRPCILISTYPELSSLRSFGSTLVSYSQSQNSFYLLTLLGNLVFSDKGYSSLTHSLVLVSQQSLNTSTLRTFLHFISVLTILDIDSTQKFLQSFKKAPKKYDIFQWKMKQHYKRVSQFIFHVQCRWRTISSIMNAVQYNFE